MMPDLPISGVLPEIVSALTETKKLVLEAPPGAGKTTAVPLALLESKAISQKIIMLEPRRLAARNAAFRMADLLGEPVGKTIGYRMRGDTKISASTHIEVVTEGILTRILQNDPELSEYSVVIFDEFHERNLASDLGLALALDIQDNLRENLCLLVMSATLDAKPVADLMGGARRISCEGQSYPVTLRYLDKPLSAHARKGFGFLTEIATVVKEAVHETEGGILVFLPGEGEIKRVEAMLQAFALKDCHIFPLYGALSDQAQKNALAPLVKGRKIILATSIAETSLTIPEISVVVDSGLSRRLRYDPNSGMARLVTELASQAESRQRAGRAGRVSEGVCYCLWSQAEHGARPEFAPAEIETSDLTGFTLELAHWGITNPREIKIASAWPLGRYEAAQSLLQDLQLLDHTGRITESGKKALTLPLHPRLGRMLVESGTAWEFSCLAALLEYGDPARKSDIGTDLARRLKLLMQPRAQHGFDQRRVEQIMKEAKRLSKLNLEPQCEMSWHEALSFAYPDRIALKREGSNRVYLTAGGKGVELPADDDLIGSKMLVIADVDGQSTTGQIRLAVTFDESALKKHHGREITQVKRCYWNKRSEKVVAIVEERFQAIALSQMVWKTVDQEAVSQALINGLRDLGLEVLNWSKKAKNLRARIAATHDKGFPDMSDQALLDEAELWLAPYLIGIKDKQGLERFDPYEALYNRLDFESHRTLNHYAPASLEAPTGTRLSIDYSGEAPKISARIQEFFGVTRHPVIGADKIPVQIELLSPAQRPIQITSDLPRFWESSYADLRKDMRGRYPKHYWPENPAEAEATRRVKPKPP